jgi:hypothetical protein
MNHSAGTLTIANSPLDNPQDNRYIGSTATGNGAYNLSGTGVVTTTVGGAVHVGYLRRGAFTQSGGTLTTPFLNVGSQANSIGTYAQSGGRIAWTSRGRCGR